MDIAADLDAWPHLCAVCGQTLTPTHPAPGRPRQWLHEAVHVDHVTVPLLLQPFD
ncbi:hypothetical protein CLV92_1195 [Kineococcus xinjiangensis]|uniref:Uncharacterized protein n=1 Tax=Kineococcus xinjiangensis TaxID=512762 RepID=A0A2S6ICG8_9ACTN|nr:hypothetical protein [Kineococcus xinjiangensis]PPK91924.1 hypothetical protein CLV92_1195 [Kineococcus xinjiangensis]